MDNKYKYTYERTADYCYKGTNVLINKLNITDDEDLFNAERELVSLRTYELNEKPLKGKFDFQYLKDIHKYLFQDVYRWAGEIRNCNIAKQDLFCLAEHIESLAKINGIYLDLTNVSKMDMIVASHESINGDYKKLKEMFKKNSHIISEEERLEYINIYCSNDLKNIIGN